jgi:hypothetical protein
MVSSLTPAHTGYRSALPAPAAQPCVASYNVLIVAVQRRLNGVFTMVANYTWAHCISDQVSFLKKRSSRAGDAGV